MVNFEIEDRIKPQLQSNNIVGIDEAGRGPWAGPVVACAFIFLDRKKATSLPFVQAIDDSKKLTAKKRAEIYHHICTYAENNNDIMFQVAAANVKEIDNMNILQATKLAMKRVIDKLPIDKNDLHIIIDGNQKMNDYQEKSEFVIGGDKKSLSIAAASIMAKVTRDTLMLELDAKYPQYSFASHKGYGTKAHMEAINKYGITEHHRKSFAPIKNLNLV